MKKEKHDHKATKKIKAIVFCAVLLFPFALILPNMFYYGFNEHATDTIYDKKTNLYETNEVTNENDILSGKIYHLSVNPKEIPQSIPFNSDNNDLYMYNMKFNRADIRGNKPIIESIENFSYCILETNSFTYYYAKATSGSYAYTRLDFDETTTSFEMDIVIGRTEYKSNYWINTYQYFTACENIPYTIESTTTTIQESMNYAVKATFNNDLISWSKNTPFKGAVSGMTSIFNMPEESTINYLLQYWTSIVIIYVIIDIVIELFVDITHTLGQRRDM